ncbi:MAG: GIY-YIG nuclease family protein, partial [Oscillospiraceae bacterium]|nr:GIY-YIG nuclease family protein [Oscillospiraceae bacterium]
AKYSIDKFCCENIDLLTSGYATSQVLFDALRSFVKSEVDAKIKSENKTKTYPLNSVYVLTDYNGNVKYVGRTNEPDRRAKEHKKDLRKQSFNFEKSEFEKW